LQVKENKLQGIFVAGVTEVRFLLSNWNQLRLAADCETGLIYISMAYAYQKYVQSEKEMLQILQVRGP
jgi:hypothetical protein